MSMPLGFGVGGFVTVGEILWRISEALRKSSEDTAEFRKVQLELHSFGLALVPLDKMLRGGAVLSGDEVDSVQAVLDDCRSLLLGFEKHVQPYMTNSPSAKCDGGVQALVGFRKKVKWSFVGKKKVELFRMTMHRNSAILTLIVQTIQQQSIRDLQKQIGGVSRAIGEPWDRKPIQFIDAIGRTYPLPLEACKRVEGFVSFVMFSFEDCQDIDLKDSIGRGEFWIVDIDGGGTTRRGRVIRSMPAILADEWNEIVESKLGRTLSMETEKLGRTLPMETKSSVSPEDLELLHRTWRENLGGSLPRIFELTRWGGRCGGKR